MNLKWFKDNWRTITLHRVWNFIQAKWRQLITPTMTPKYEQYLWRNEMVAKKSPECLKGKCVHCGCDTPDKFWESDACAEGCYPEWMGRDAWAAYKELIKELDKEANK